ncbi:acetyl-CoA carboxylase biotin carboxyl carrier protein [uncultured Maricaulis sp.]|uniref:acetyl-CoA carboxylase biotin carboxyl carrier protein n=1 Tax=uncultured Maricaulis sp. TaxID=174710 RepID=UPI0030DB469C|tara:strand:- start:10097 stop:10579 length:483 start_codon:yes stop_codon:yes gene_type:complete
MSSETRSRSPIDPEIVRELADILRETDLSEIEVERGDLRLRIARQLQAAPVVQAVAAPAAPAPAGYAVETPGPVGGAGDLSAHPGVVNSPMVGTAYLKPNPDSENFVKVGETVKKGDTILLIEAMKTFNPIVAEKAGKISEILVEEGQPVEYGEPLFILI